MQAGDLGKLACCTNNGSVWPQGPCVRLLQPLRPVGLCPGPREDKAGHAQGRAHTPFITCSAPSPVDWTLVQIAPNTISSPLQQLMTQLLKVGSLSGREPQTQHLIRLIQPHSCWEMGLRWKTSPRTCEEHQPRSLWDQRVGWLLGFWDQEMHWCPAVLRLVTRH